MEITTPKPGHSRAAEDSLSLGDNDDDIDDASDQCDEEEEESETDLDQRKEVRSVEPLDDVYRDLCEEFQMPEPEKPLPPSISESFGDFVAQEAAKARADQAAPPPEPEETLPEKEVGPEAAAGGESPAKPDPAEMIAEAVRAAKAAGPEQTVEEATNPGSDQSDLTKECPLYIINRKLSNCKVITSTERCCLGLLNSLMQKHGYAYVSNEQLAWWLDMKSANSVRNMLAKLTKMKLIQNTGRRNLEIRWVVCPELQNPKRDRS